jgi:DNA-binding transcriptional LysR family regulator
MMNSIYAIQRAVESGAGIAALPEYMVRNNPNLEVLLPEAERAGVDVYFVYPEERRNSKRIAIFRDFLLESLRNEDF